MPHRGRGLYLARLRSLYYAWHLCGRYELTLPQGWPPSINSLGRDFLAAPSAKRESGLINIKENSLKRAWGQALPASSRPVADGAQRGTGFPLPSLSSPDRWSDAWLAGLRPGVRAVPWVSRELGWLKHRRERLPSRWDRGRGSGVTLVPGRGGLKKMGRVSWLSCRPLPTCTSSLLVFAADLLRLQHSRAGLVTEQTRLSTPPPPLLGSAARIV